MVVEPDFYFIIDKRFPVASSKECLVLAHGRNKQHYGSFDMLSNVIMKVGPPRTTVSGKTVENAGLLKTSTSH